MVPPIEIRAFHPRRRGGGSGQLSSRSSARAFVRRHTSLAPVPGLERIRIHQATEILPLWGAIQVETHDPDAPLPYWAFAWSGGLALARHLAADPALVAGRTVLDLGTGSGLVAIAAAIAGAAAVEAVDIDPFAVAAATLNANANDVRIQVRRRDILDGGIPEADVILAGDCWYEASLARRVLAWAARARDAGVDVVLGDPKRRYLPTDGLRELASYDVRTTTDLEDLAHKRAWVYALDRGADAQD